MIVTFLSKESDGCHNHHFRWRLGLSAWLARPPRPGAALGPCAALRGWYG
jgi:hypothetical protein